MRFRASNSVAAKQGFNLPGIFAGWLLLMLALLMLPASSLSADDAVNLRYPAPSPDGTNICFSYQGDLWLVSAQGGRANRLTVHLGYDGYPCWSPDGRFIAFSSDRNGNFDVYIVPATGGSEIRLTYNTDDDIVSGWDPKGKKVLFTSRRELENTSVWEVPISGSHPRPLTRIESDRGRYSSDGETLVFTRGAVPWWRKGYRGSAACDIFTKDISSGAIDRVTFFSGNELDAWLIPSGSEVIYLSDSTGCYNLFRRNLISGKVTQITSHRLCAGFPSLSADGSLLAYELNGEIYLYDTRLSQGRKLMVDVTGAGKDNDMTFKSVDSGITELRVAPDGQQIAYVVGGEIFCRDITGMTQSRVSHSVAVNCDIAWTPDSRGIVCSENGNGSFNVYLIKPANDSRNRPAVAKEFNEEELVSSDRFCMNPTISPTGSRLAYIRGKSSLLSVNLDKRTERTFSDNEIIGDYAWSGDGRYIVYTQFTSDWMNQLLIADTESGSVELISNLPGGYSSPRFSPDGKLIYYLNQGDIYYLYLDRRVSEMTVPERREFLARNGTSNSIVYPPVMVDFDGIQERHVRLTSKGDVTEAIQAPGTNYIIYADRSGNIMAHSLDGDREQVLMKEADAPHQLQFAAAGDLLYYLNGDGKIESLNVQTGETLQHPIRAEWQVSRSAQYKQVFAEAWAMMRENFYDESLHGVDWENTRNRFSARVASVTNDHDFYDIVREMLGELNASHCNIWPAASTFPENGWIGVVPDFQDNSPGVTVADVVPHSPSSRLISKVDKHDKITAVNGTKLESSEDIYSHLLGQAQQEVKLDLISRNGISRSVYLTPVTTDEYRELTYKEKVEQLRSQVSQQSRGKIAYFHLGQITPKSLDRFEAELLKYAEGRQGLILDLRGNIGGAAHDRLINILSRREYISHRPRHGSPGYDGSAVVPPHITVLIDERTSSDAEIVAQGIRELGLGEIVGQRSYGAVIGTEQHTLLNGATLSIPTVGWFSMTGDNLENNGVQPDFVIPLDLTAAEKGEDNQLKETVERMLGRL